MRGLGPTNRPQIGVIPLVGRDQQQYLNAGRRGISLLSGARFLKNSIQSTKLQEAGVGSFSNAVAVHFTPATFCRPSKHAKFIFLKLLRYLTGQPRRLAKLWRKRDPRQKKKALQDQDMPPQ
jgi:hypothetical protein